MQGEGACGSCRWFERNGTRFGGKCTNVVSQWRGITVSSLKDDCPDHYPAEQMRATGNV